MEFHRCKLLLLICQCDVTRSFASPPFRVRNPGSTKTGVFGVHCMTWWRRPLDGHLSQGPVVRSRFARRNFLRTRTEPEYWYAFASFAQLADHANQVTSKPASNKENNNTNNKNMTKQAPLVGDTRGSLFPYDRHEEEFQPTRHYL